MRVVGALTIVAVLIPGAVQADEARQSREARRIAWQYAQCVVKNKHDLASKAVLSNANNSVLLKQYPQLIDENCMGAVSDGGIKFGGDLYRYGLAEALINMDYAKAGPTEFTDRLPLAHIGMPSAIELQRELVAAKGAKARDEAQRQYDKSLSAAWLSRYGECIARAAPTEVRYWILTRPDTPEEVSRISALMPAFQNCLNGGTLRFSRVVLRGAVALNYYRLANATVVPTSGKTS